MITKTISKNQGFIALITAVIVSAILLLLATNLSLTGFYNRSNILDFELKEVSFNLAEACIDTAILNMINDSSYNPVNEIFGINGHDCIVESVNGNIIKTKADYRNYITHLEVEVDPSDMNVASFKEI